MKRNALAHREIAPRGFFLLSLRFLRRHEDYSSRGANSPPRSKIKWRRERASTVGSMAAIGEQLNALPVTHGIEGNALEKYISPNKIARMRARAILKLSVGRGIRRGDGSISIKNHSVCLIIKFDKQLPMFSADKRERYLVREKKKIGKKNHRRTKRRTFERRWRTRAYYINPETRSKVGKHILGAI